MNPKQIPLQNFTPRQATEHLEHYTREGHEPTLSLILSMLVHTGGSNVDAEGKQRWGQDAHMRKWHEFLSFARVHRILQAVKSGEVDNRVLECLQHHLSQEGKGMRMPALWIYYSGWLKSRILDCFYSHKLPGDKNTLLIHRRLKLAELMKIPLRPDPYEG
jgi:hypothetical protein